MPEAESPVSFLSYLLDSIPFWAGMLLLLVCIVHVIRTGRSFYWIFVLLFFPYLGSVVYFFLEIMPDLRRGEFSFGGAKYKRFQKPGRGEIRRLEQQADYASTVQNRMLVADAYLQVGRMQEANAIYNDCLGGAYRDDPALIWGVAQSAVTLAQWQEAVTALDRLDAQKWSNYHKERSLLRARALGALGKTDEARTLFESILHGFSGEEARCRYALLLKQTGDDEMARSLFQQILDDTRRMGGSYKLRQKPWRDIAKQELASYGKR